MEEVGPQSGLKDMEPKSVIPDDIWARASSLWIDRYVRNSPIAQHVEAWNHLGGILPKLRELLLDELTRPPGL